MSVSQELDSGFGHSQWARPHPSEVRAGQAPCLLLVSIGGRSLPCQCGWEQGQVTPEPKGSLKNAKPHRFGFEVEKNAFWLRFISIFFSS